MEIPKAFIAQPYFKIALMTTQKYRHYKPSNIPWIGDVPEHWEVKKLKYVVSHRLMYGANEPSEFDDPNQPRYIRITDFGDDGNLRMDTFKSLPYEIAKDYLLKEGDILFARSGATVGKTFQFKNYTGKACFAGYLIKARPEQSKIDSDFLYFFTKSGGYEDWKNSIFNQATIQNIGADKYNQLELPLPPLPEQTAIAHYLDTKTAQIDRLIVAKQQLLALLREERVALINRAVTRGLDPDAKMKDSGVAWLGEVPEGWEVVPMTKYLDSVIDYRGRTPTKAEQGVFLVTARNIKNGKIDYEVSQEYILEEELEKTMSRGELEIGDVLFTTEAPLGEVANVDRTDVAIAQRVIKFRAKKEHLDNYFLKNWIMTSGFQQDLHSLSTGSTAIGIKASKLFSLKLLLPSISEQKRINKFIEEKNTAFNETAQKITTEIALLQEYRTALISEVVTGKIKITES